MSTVAPSGAEPATGHGAAAVARRRAPARSARLIALAAAVALHAYGIDRLMQMQPSTPTAEPSAPVFVQFIEEPRTIVPPRPMTPPPKPVPRKQAREQRPTPVTPTVPPAPIIATEASAPTTFEAVHAPATPPALPAAAVPTPAAPVPSAAPVVPPLFNAAYLENPEPAYPQASRRFGEQGRVLLKVQVSAQGSPLQVELERSSGHSRLDLAAREAVRRWRFVPARRGDEAVSGWVIVPIVFQLGG